jgi:organic radical activating enzyme
MKLFELIETDEYPTFDFKVTLKPSFRCNQACWFCDEYDNKSYEWSKEDCDKVLDKLDSVLKPYQSIFIYFYGGEPTLSKYYEYLHYELIKRHKDKKLFIQTQTNGSMHKERLITFLNTLELQDNHILDISTSVHLNKQKISDLIDKLKILREYNALGNIFPSTEYNHEEQFIEELRLMIHEFDNKVKIKFTEIGAGIIDTQEAQLYPSDQGDIKSFEFRYFTQKYPFLLNYLEEGFNFQVDDKVVNYSIVKATDIHKQVRFMKCECGTKNLVIDHNLKMYRCNDDFKNNIGIQDISEDLVIKNKYCLNKACYDGLEFKKWKEVIVYKEKEIVDVCKPCSSSYCSYNCKRDI